MSKEIQQCQAILLAYFSLCSDKKKISHFNVSQIGEKIGKSFCDQDIIDATATLPDLLGMNAGYIWVKGSNEAVYEAAQKNVISARICNAVKEFAALSR